jgi:hypothetical protein
MKNKTSREFVLIFLLIIVPTYKGNISDYQSFVAKKLKKGK